MAATNPESLSLVARRAKTSKDAAVSQFKIREVPDIWNERYDDEDKDGVKFVTEWLNTNQRTTGFLAAAASMNKSMIAMLLGGTYTGKIPQNMQKLLQTIQTIEERKNESGLTPFVETSVSRIVNTACNQARITRMFSVVTANVGTGKTRALKDYARERDNTWLVESYPGMSWGVMLDNIMRTMCIPARTYSNVHLKFEHVLSHVRHIENGLMILDEAETVQGKSLQGVRRLSDLGGIGVVLAGTPALYQLIKAEGGHFDQVRSRSPFFPEPIYQITKDDARAIIAVSFDDRPEVFDDEGEILPELFNAFWVLCGGSIRMLVDGLIPAVVRYGIPQHNQVTADIVLAVAKKVLNLTPKKPN